MFLRALFLGVMAFMGLRWVKKQVAPEPPKTTVKGQNDHDPLDLSRQDVADAKFEDL